MKFKSGVKLHGIQPQAILAAIIAKDVYAAHGYELTITSVNDSTHGAKSLHYSGLAIDLRTRDVQQADWQTIVEEIKTRLGTEFDVILESDHIHIEWDPR